jgi:hypothetical protein
MIALRCAKFLAVPLVLSACSPPPAEPAPLVESLAVSASETNSYDTASTIADLMNFVIMPNAEYLWNSVSYVVTAEGTTETFPQTDADWTDLRTSAITLIEAGNMLMLPGRAITNAAADPATAAFQYTPDEIAQLLADDPEPWQRYAQQLQESTRMTLQAIEFRDLMGLQEFGAQINEACEGCHASYWYRAPGVMVPQ